MPSDFHGTPCSFAYCSYWTLHILVNFVFYISGLSVQSHILLYFASCCHVLCTSRMLTMLPALRGSLRSLCLHAHQATCITKMKEEGSRPWLCCVVGHLLLVCCLPQPPLASFCLATHQVLVVEVISLSLTLLVSYAWQLNLDAHLLCVCILHLLAKCEECVEARKSRSLVS